MDLARWVRLDHYKGLELSPAATVVDGHGESGVPVLPRPEDVQMQKNKLYETMKLNALLKAEEAQNAAVLAQLKARLGGVECEKGEGQSPLAFLTAGSRDQEATERPLTQNVQYALAQLPALRELLVQLRGAMQDLPNVRSKVEDEDSVDARRRRYLERQAQRAVQRRGLVGQEASEAAALQAAVGGRKIGRDEVEGMEAIVQALGEAAQK